MLMLYKDYFLEDCNTILFLISIFSSILKSHAHALENQHSVMELPVEDQYKTINHFF